LSEAKTWLAPNRRLFAYHCNPAAPAADEQRQAALAIPQRQIFRWQQPAPAIPLHCDLPTRYIGAALRRREMLRVDLAELSFLRACGLATIVAALGGKKIGWQIAAANNLG
jgi:hypothetical protein